MVLAGRRGESLQGLASFMKEQARSTTEVVPSPTSESCDRAMSTSVRAAGCTMSRCFMIVAPSFEMVVRPLWLTIILSIPRGPSVVRIVSATVYNMRWNGLGGIQARGEGVVGWLGGEG